MWERLCKEGREGITQMEVPAEGRALPHLALAEQASLLKPGPDALDAAGVLWVHMCIPAHALVLQHERVIDHTWATDPGVSHNCSEPYSAHPVLITVSS